MLATAVPKMTNNEAAPSAAARSCLDFEKLHLSPRRYNMVEDTSPLGKGVLHGRKSQVKEFQELGPNDILSGRGRVTRNHIGNQQFRSFINQNVDQYIAAPTSIEKTGMIIALVKTLREEMGARFLKQTRNGYVLLGKGEAHEKVGHALRDATKARAKAFSSTDLLQGMSLEPSDEQKVASIATYPQPNQAESMEGNRIMINSSIESNMHSLCEKYHRGMLGSNRPHRSRERQCGLDTMPKITTTAMEENEVLIGSLKRLIARLDEECDNCINTPFLGPTPVPWDIAASHTSDKNVARSCEWNPNIV
jgi:hypothetical protein